MIQIRQQQTTLTDKLSCAGVVLVSVGSICESGPTLGLAREKVMELLENSRAVFIKVAPLDPERQVGS